MYQWDTCIGENLILLLYSKKRGIVFYTLSALVFITLQKKFRQFHDTCSTHMQNLYIALVFVLFDKLRKKIEIS